MASRFFTLCTANLIPLLALSGAGASGMLLHSLLSEGNQGLGLTSRSPGTWMSLLACATAGLLCLCIALWWLAGLVFYYSALARTRRSTLHIQLPAWAPGLLKTLAGASLGLGALAPTQAYALPSEQAISVTARVHDGETSSPLFPQASQINHDGEALSDDSALASATSPLFSQAHPQGRATVTVLPVTAKSYQPISPLFGGATRVQPDFSEDVAATTYTVAPGDSLWSIAEDQLTPDASGAEVLALVHTIWQLNQKTIPTLDTLIFPGQTIALPR